ncbi:MAG: thiamine diphosphokinase [Lachnospiraceae bacterium]|nr:thiamine diphosphokinase [Lachnospiraceae bacterium]
MENTGKCYIVGAGENFGLNFNPKENDYVIAADAGYRYLEQAGITPDMVVGDFDTLKYVPDHPNIVQLKPEKDITDTWEAVTKGFEKGYKEFHLYACMGGRVEHSIANFQLLSHIAEEGGRGYLYDDRSILTVIKDSEIVFEARKKGFISVFSLTDNSIGVDICGLKYEVNNAELTNSFPLGVSNEFIGKPSKISVKNGTLLIVY